MEETTRFRRIRGRIRLYIGFFSGWEKVEMIPRSVRERNRYRRKLFWILFILVAILVLIFVIYKVLSGILDIPKSEFSYYEKYLSSISFFGIIFAAIITITTTYFIVHNSKKIDCHKERLSVMPFLEITTEVLPISKYASNPDDCENQIGTTVKNIGNGIAINIEDDDNPTTGEIWGNITVENSKQYETHIIASEESITFNFEDIFENKYVQEFTISYYKGADIARVNCKAPELVKRTRRLRYCQ